MHAKTVFLTKKVPDQSPEAWGFIRHLNQGNGNVKIRPMAMLTIPPSPCQATPKLPDQLSTPRLCKQVAFLWPAAWTMHGLLVPCLLWISLGKSSPHCDKWESQILQVLWQYILILYTSECTLQLVLTVWSLPLVDFDIYVPSPSLPCCCGFAD